MEKVVIIDLPQRGGDSYANLAARNEVESKLQNNNVMCNLNFPKIGSNLMDYSQRLELFQKTDEEKIKLKKLKKELGGSKEKEEFVKAFLNSEMPNWNINFIYKEN